MTTTVSQAAATAMLAGPGLVPALDAGAAPARLRIYGAPRPAPGGTPAGALIATVPLLRPCGTVTAGVLALAVPSTDGPVLASAAPTWARLEDGDGTRFFDLTARLIGTPDAPEDPAEIVVDATALQVGALLRVVSGTVSIAG